jgi:oxygen-dependent protoporphyrinogen oxidase
LTTSARIFADGALHPLPANMLMGIPADLESARVSGLFTQDALDRIARELTETWPALDSDVSVGELVRQRLGREVLERLVEPLLGGVYAGRADGLSLRATIPALAARLGAVGGSIVAAARTVTDRGARATSSDPVFVSIAGGLGTLPEAVAARGHFAVRLSTTARAVSRTADGFAVECGPAWDSERILADSVVVATPPSKAAQLLRQVAPAASAELADIDSSSMAIVSFAFRDVQPPQGSGLLVGDRERVGVKAVTISSQKWPGTPAGLTVLRASVGRIGDVRDLQRDDSDLIALVRSDLVKLTGIDAEPVDALVTRWGGALPQYAPGHVDRVIRIRSAVESISGLAVCGAAYDGVGIPACVASAQRAAKHVVASLDRPTLPVRGE